MTPEHKKRKIASRILWHSVKWAIPLLTIGIFFLALSYLDGAILPLAKWKNLLVLANKLGNIFFALALLIFIYKVIVLTCWHFEKQLDIKKHIAAIVLSNLRKGLRIIFILVALNIVISLIEPSEFYLNLSYNIVNTIIIAFIGWTIIQILHTLEAVLYQYMLNISPQESLRMKALYTKMHIIRNIATIIIVLITIAAILMSYNSVRNIGISLLASAGFITAIAGLAAQKTLSSLFAGLQIALGQPIKLGDTVVIEDISGTVEEITFTYVVLKLMDRRRLILPINYFLEKPFENWSHDNTSLRTSLKINVDFMMPFEPLRKELDTILQQSPYWDGTSKKLEVTNISDRAVEITIKLSAATSDNISELRAEVQEKILAFIREQYPHCFPKLHMCNQQPNKLQS